jgi:ribonuclease Z
VTWLVQPRLINDVFSDPGLLIDFRFGRRAILFDLGDIHALASREILRVSHVFVSHTHVDHFAGFDRLLRLALRRPAPLHLVGPEGFIERVRHKLGAYTWNLLDQGAAAFSITAMEFVADRLTQACRFCAREAFEPRAFAPPELPAGTVLDEEAFRIHASELDHGIPCLAFAFQEKLRINVRKQGLDALGLPVGPWLNDAKRAIRRGDDDDTQVFVAPDRPVPLGLLKAEALRLAAGQRIAYVVDAAYHPANVGRITALARRADQLFIETAFLEADAVLAAARRHLTAAQAGAIARAAEAVHITPFHFSPRYLDREDQLRRELELAFRGGGGP